MLDCCSQVLGALLIIGCCKFTRSMPPPRAGSISRSICREGSLTTPTERVWRAAYLRLRALSSCRRIYGRVTAARRVATVPRPAVADRTHGREACHDLRQRPRVEPAMARLVSRLADRDRALHLRLAARGAALPLAVRFPAVELHAAHRSYGGHVRESDESERHGASSGFRARPRWRRRARWGSSPGCASAHGPRSPTKDGRATMIRPVAQPRCHSPRSTHSKLLPGTRNWPVRREDPSARGQRARQRQSPHATATAGWMRRRRVPRVSGARLGGCMGDTAARACAGDGWGAEECS